MPKLVYNARTNTWSPAPYLRPRVDVKTKQGQLKNAGVRKLLDRPPVVPDARPFIRHFPTFRAPEPTRPGLVAATDRIPIRETEYRRPRVSPVSQQIDPRTRPLAQPKHLREEPYRRPNKRTWNKAAKDTGLAKEAFWGRHAYDDGIDSVQHPETMPIPNRPGFTNYNDADLRKGRLEMAQKMYNPHEDKPVTPKLMHMGRNRVPAARQDDIRQRVRKEQGIDYKKGIPTRKRGGKKILPPIKTSSLSRTFGFGYNV